MSGSFDDGRNDEFGYFGRGGGGSGLFGDDYLMSGGFRIRYSDDVGGYG